MLKVSTLDVLVRIAEALERLVPYPLIDRIKIPETGSAFVWNKQYGFEYVDRVASVGLDLLKGISTQRETLLVNTQRFVQGLPANNALLWGARGMGKSALVKAVHQRINEDNPEGLVLVEIHREELDSLPFLLQILRSWGRQIIIFCDDLSFESMDVQYKSLKTILEGGLEGRPSNVLFYATSNRRHLLPRSMIENEVSSAIISHEVVDEKISLSDRFGLWLGFHGCDQETYLCMVRGYVDCLGLAIESDTLEQQALSWAMTRGSRSGRIAWQFIQDLSGRLGKRLQETSFF